MIVRHGTSRAWIPQQPTLTIVQPVMAWIFWKTVGISTEQLQQLHTPIQPRAGVQYAVEGLHAYHGTGGHYHVVCWVLPLTCRWSRHLQGHRWTREMEVIPMYVHDTLRTLPLSTVVLLL